MTASLALQVQHRAHQSTHTARSTLHKPHLTTSLKVATLPVRPDMRTTVETKVGHLITRSRHSLQILHPVLLHHTLIIVISNPPPAVTLDVIAILGETSNTTTTMDAVQKISKLTQGPGVTCRTLLSSR